MRTAGQLIASFPHPPNDRLSISRTTSLFHADRDRKVVSPVFSTKCLEFEYFCELTALVALHMLNA
jgi:hypothetical protein